VFVEGRSASQTESSDCDFDEACTTRTSHAGIVGAGVELLHLRHFAFELNARVIADGHTPFLRPAKGGDLLARAERLRSGRSKISGIVRLWADGAPDRPVSRVTGSYVHIQ
jgi:acyl-coenzyme A thioesterase PaaI-like protein